MFTQISCFGGKGSEVSFKKFGLYPDLHIDPPSSFVLTSALPFPVKALCEQYLDLIALAHADIAFLVCPQCDW